MREETRRERGTDEDYYRIWNRLPRDTRDYDRDMVLRVPDIVEAD